MEAATSNTAELDRIPLRERKYARTKLALLNAVTGRLEAETFAEITVESLCRDVDISVPTFFNYFPRKTDVLVYAIMLWGIEAHARSLLLARRRKRALSILEGVFEMTAQQMVENPRLSSELLGRQALRQGPPQFQEITRAERLMAFPDLPLASEVPARGNLSLFRTYLRQAVRQDELPRNTSIELAASLLYSVFVGVPIKTLWDDPARVAGLYRKQLAVVWRGLGARHTR